MFRMTPESRIIGTWETVLDGESAVLRALKNDRFAFRESDDWMVGRWDCNGREYLSDVEDEMVIGFLDGRDTLVLAESGGEAALVFTRAK